jgi:hypothetical protein
VLLPAVIAGIAEKAGKSQNDELVAE